MYHSSCIIAFSGENSPLRDSAIPLRYLAGNDTMSVFSLKVVLYAEHYGQVICVKTALPELSTVSFQQLPSGDFIMTPELSVSIYMSPPLT